VFYSGTLVPIHIITITSFSYSKYISLNIENKFALISKLYSSLHAHFMRSQKSNMEQLSRLIPFGTTPMSRLTSHLDSSIIPTPPTITLIVPYIYAPPPSTFFHVCILSLQIPSSDDSITAARSVSEPYRTDSQRAAG
jgi:hypothetical protein